MRLVLIALLLAGFLIGCNLTEPPPETDPTVTLTFQPGHEDAVVFVAYQDGAAPWQPADGVDGSYTFPVSDPEGRYGVAFVCEPSTEGGNVELGPLVVHATLDEADALTLPCLSLLYPETVRESELTGTVTGYDPTAWDVWVDTSEVGVGVPSDGAYRAAPISDGIHDVVASFTADPGQRWPDRIAIARDVVVEGTGTADIDYDDGGDIEAYTLTVTGLAEAQEFDYGSYFYTANGLWLSLSDGWIDGAPTGPTVPLRAAPLSILGPGDMHSVSATTWEDVDGMNHSWRVERFYRQGADMELALPAGRLTPEVTAVPSGPYARYEATWNDVGADLVSLYVGLDTLAGDEMDWEVLLTPGWATEGRYELPDLSPVTGWRSDWSYSAADVDGVFWSVNAVISDAAGLFDRTFDWSWRDGDEIALISTRGSLAGAAPAATR